MPWIDIRSHKTYPISSRIEFLTIAYKTHYLCDLDFVCFSGHLLPLNIVTLVTLASFLFPWLWMVTSFLLCKSQPKCYLLKRISLTTWFLARSLSHHLVLFSSEHSLCLLVDYLPHPTSPPTHTHLNVIHDSKSLSFLLSVVSSPPTKLKRDPTGPITLPGYPFHSLIILRITCAGSVYHHRRQVQKKHEMCWSHSPLFLRHLYFSTSPHRDWYNKHSINICERKKEEEKEKHKALGWLVLPLYLKLRKLRNFQGRRAFSAQITQETQDNLVTIALKETLRKQSSQT